jgi:hypothetical protein
MEGSRRDFIDVRVPLVSSALQTVVPDWPTILAANTYLSGTYHCTSVRCVMAHRRGTRRLCVRLCLLLLLTPPFFSERLSTRQHEPSPHRRVGPTLRPIENFDFTTKVSLRLLTPTFPLHLLWMSTLFALSAIAVMDLLLKVVYITCSAGICYTTGTTLEWPSRTELRYLLNIDY